MLKYGKKPGIKKSPDVETPGLWYLDLISVVFCKDDRNIVRIEAVKIALAFQLEAKTSNFFC
jgi:hypothetical protein